MEKQNNTSDQDTPPADSTPTVTGIGGIFFFTDNPQETKEWYSKNLGLKSMNGVPRVLIPEISTNLKR
jgi:hypothetical protein